MRYKSESFDLLMVVAVVGVLFHAAGCESSAKRPHEVRADPLSINNYPQVTAEGKHLDEFLVCSDATVVTAPGQPMRVTVPGRLAYDEEINVQYRFEFFDDEGQPLEAKPKWRYMRLPARTQVFWEGSAIDNSAVSWRLIIRPAR